MSRYAFSALAFVALSAAGCGGSGETTTVDVTTTVEATTTVEVTTTTATAPAETTAEEEPALDPDDVDGPLDVRDVTATRDGDVLRTEITMYEPWPSSLLGHRSVVEPGTERITILYDIDLDGRADYRGAMALAEGFPGLFIAGRGQRFETVPVRRSSTTTAVVTHPVDVFFVVAGEEEVDPEQDIQIAVRTALETEIDRAPDTGWVSVPFRP
jgi:hypothetical protein